MVAQQRSQEHGWRNEHPRPASAPTIKMRMDQFLASVRAVELKATSVSMGMGGGVPARGAKLTMATVNGSITHTTATYKGTHATP